VLGRLTGWLLGFLSEGGGILLFGLRGPDGARQVERESLAGLLSRGHR
jgi:hypothetical protein